MPKGLMDQWKLSCRSNVTSEKLCFIFSETCGSTLLAVNTISRCPHCRSALERRAIRIRLDFQNVDSNKSGETICICMKYVMNEKLRVRRKA